MPYKVLVHNKPDLKIDTKRREIAEKLKLVVEGKLERLQIKINKSEDNLYNWENSYIYDGSDSEEEQAEDDYIQIRIDYWQQKLERLNGVKEKLLVQLQHAITVIKDANQRILLASLEHRNLPLDDAMIHKNFSGMF